MATQIVKIALDVPLNRLFDYINPGFNAQVGARAIVGFAGRQLVGIIMEVVQRSDLAPEKLRPVDHIFEEVVFNHVNFRLMQFCADYYHYPLGQILLASLPLRLRQLKPAVTRKCFVYQLKPNTPLPEISKRQIVLQRIVNALQINSQLSEDQLALISASWRKAIFQLEAAGCLAKTEIVAVKPSLPSSFEAPILNAEQQLAITSILDATERFKPWLLYGITGSGKTEVYIQLLRHILAEKNAQVLILVPEINLTPQLESRFRTRLSEYALVTLHSNLSDSERLQNWQAASTGAAKIVIGTRLSVFTPMPYLKMIVIDEEHDSSYKQQDGMRYHARDVAMMRAKQLNIPIILGSATPSLEVWHLAKKGQYGLLSLNARAVSLAQLPRIQCIDIAKSPVENGLSPLLLNALRERLQRGEQSLLFINRRGYAPVLHCNACLWVAPCLRCSARLVVHLSQRRLKCHHCGHEQKIPPQCPSCGNADLSPIGQATQRLQQTLMDKLPGARIARVDRDSVRNKDALIQILSQVHRQEIDILVGTQMLAKGHDFPNLTLVGVIDTDTALYSADFRASERLFAQLMQVAGRAGRAEKAGEVLIQTAFPQHALFNALRTQNYPDFADSQLQERALMQFPPTRFFALLKAEAADFSLVQQFLTQAAMQARTFAADVTVYDAVRPQMERLKGMERGQLLLQSASRHALQRLLKPWISQLRAEKQSAKIRWVLDIDPLEF